MANIKSAIKRIDIMKRNNAYNNAIKAQIRTLSKKVTSPESLAEAISVLDKAVTKGVLHKNTVARKKSSLTKAFNAAQSK
jgi:small subunit ribosomal protein S20